MLSTRRHRRVLLARPHRASCFRPKPPTLDTLTDDEHHRPPPAEQEYGYLSYHHHVVLRVDEVGRLVHTVTDVFGTRGLTTPFLFSILPSTSTLPESVASYRLSSVLVCRSLLQT